MSNWQVLVLRWGGGLLAVVFPLRRGFFVAICQWLGDDELRPKGVFHGCSNFSPASAGLSFCTKSRAR